NVLIGLSIWFVKALQHWSQSSNRRASFLQRHSSRLFRKLVRMFSNAFARHPTGKMSLMQELLLTVRILTNTSLADNPPNSMYQFCVFRAFREKFCLRWMTS